MILAPFYQALFRLQGYKYQAALTFSQLPLFLHPLNRLAQKIVP